MLQMIGMNLRFDGVHSYIIWLQGRGILHTERRCNKCDRDMKISPRACLDTVAWRCGKCKCTVSLRTGTFLERVKISLDLWLLTVYYWAMDVPVKQVVEMTQQSDKKVIQHFRWLRGICSRHKIVNHPEPCVHQAKQKFTRMRGCKREWVPEYLDELMWRERYGRTGDDAFNNILRHIAESSVNERSAAVSVTLV